MGPPLLSDYKKAFAGKRLCQNLFGGPRFISVPFPYVLIQFFLFILPSLIIYGIEFIKIEGIRKVLIFGSTLFFLDVGISILTLFLKRERNVVRPRTRIKSQEQNLFAEEDTVSWEKFIMFELTKFVLLLYLYIGSKRRCSSPFDLDICSSKCGLGCEPWVCFSLIYSIILLVIPNACQQRDVHTLETICFFCSEHCQVQCHFECSTRNRHFRYKSKTGCPLSTFLRWNCFSLLFP